MPDPHPHSSHPSRRSVFAARAIGVALAIGTVAAAFAPADSSSCVVAARTAHPLAIVSVIGRLDLGLECDQPAPPARSR
jgi:hypothetical protein